MSGCYARGVLACLGCGVEADVLVKQGERALVPVELPDGWASVGSYYYCEACWGSERLATLRAATERLAEVWR